MPYYMNGLMEPYPHNSLYDVKPSLAQQHAKADMPRRLQAGERGPMFGTPGVWG
jgi:hypothetical protein